MKVNEEMPILKSTKTSTGVLDLDIILEGGYSNPANILVLGPTGMEKAALGFHFIASIDQKKECAIAICSDCSPANVVEKAASIGINLQKEWIYFIDCYSSTLGGKKPPVATDEISIVSGPGALNDLSLAINELIKKSAGKRIHILFYSLSTFVLYNPKDSIVKFLQVVGGRLKNAEATTLFLVEEGVHDKQLVGVLEHSMDWTIELFNKGDAVELNIPGIGITIPLKLGPSGITVL